MRHLVRLFVRHLSSPIPMRTRRVAFIAALAAAAAVVPSVAAAAPVTTPASVVADTTFNPVGSYALSVSVAGEAMTMAFTVEKKVDGSFTGLFKHDAMGEFATTSFKVEGRTMKLSIETPGGPANIEMTVAEDNTVTGAWGMQGDGSKIAGKKVS